MNVHPEVIEAVNKSRFESLQELPIFIENTNEV